jgi:hypothetical protein
LSHETPSSPQDPLVDDPPIKVVDEPPPVDPQAAETYAEGELDEAERHGRLEQLQAETAHKKAETELKLAEADDKRAETELRKVQRDQAKDDRFLRLGAAGISIVGVVLWTCWMCDFIVCCSLPAGNKHKLTAESAVQVALIANTGVAIIGLFAIVLRGLFKVAEEKKEKSDK